MIRRPPRSTRTDTLFPYTTLFRSSVIEEYLGTGAARAGVAHRPEIIRCRYADDAAFGKPRALAPQVQGAVFGMLDGERQSGGIHAPAACYQIPGEAARSPLEIVHLPKIAGRSEEPREGNACDSPCRPRWLPV